jgi:VanZ family protein
MIRFLKKYLGILFFPIVWTIVIGILLALPGSMLPSESGFSIPQFDKVVHIGLFGGFVFLWNLYLSNRVAAISRLLRWFFLIYVLANAYGIGMEYVQKYYIPMRDFDEADIIADMIGAGLAYGLSHLLLLAPATDSRER